MPLTLPRLGAEPIVVGYERWRAGLPSTDSAISAAAAEDLLLCELGCGHCHRGLSPIATDILTSRSKPAPRLLDVGKRVRPEFLRRFLFGAIRPYVATRMPDFGVAHAQSLTQLFRAVDRPRGVQPFERVGRNRYGRTLCIRWRTIR